MLQIRLNKGPSLDGGSGVKSLPAETVTVACPDHLILADLPVAKGLGSATSSARVKTVGRRSRRQLGERVHFCVRCDFPIAIYGRMTPCEHVFCLDCARSDSMCYLCDERIQKIQTIKLMEGIFICAAPHCLKSFLKKTEFESHIHGSHANLLEPNIKKEEANELDAFSVKPAAALESSIRAPQKPGFPPSSNPPLTEREDRARSQPPRERTPLRPLMQPRMPPYYGQNPNTPSDLVPDGGSLRPDGLNPQNHLPQQNFEAPSDKPQQGILSDPHCPPAYYQQSPNFAVPMNPGSILPSRPPFGFPPFPSDGAPFYGTPLNYEVTRSDSNSEATPPGFSEPHAHPWGAGLSRGAPFEVVQGGQGSITDGSGIPLDPQARAAFFQGEYGRNSSNSLAAPMSNKALDPSQVGNLADSRDDGKGMLASMPPPPPGPPPPHLLQQKHDSYFSGEPSHDGKNYGWSQQKGDGFGSS